MRSNSAAGFRAQLQGALESCQSLFSLKRKQEGFDIVLDALGGFYFKESFELLSRGGRMVTFGAATFMSPKVCMHAQRLGRGSWGHASYVEPEKKN